MQNLRKFLPTEIALFLPYLAKIAETLFCIELQFNKSSATISCLLEVIHYSFYHQHKSKIKKYLKHSLKLNIMDSQLQI